MTEYTDPASGRRYTVDAATGQSRWVDDQPPPPPPPARAFAQPYPPPYPQHPDAQGAVSAPPKKKRRLGLWIFIGILVAFLDMCSAAMFSGGDDSATTVPSGSAKPAASSKAAAPAKPSAKQSGTVSQRNALKKARSYLEFKAFSKKGLINQLTSEAGDGFPKADATWAVNQLTDVNWNEQAVRSGKSYLDMQGFSRAGLIQQLSSDAGEGFTLAQATYAADQLGL